MNRERVMKGLPRLECSERLREIALTHAMDQMAHVKAGGSFGKCNLHTWFQKNQDYKDCCYTSDHANPKCMWEKPKEIFGKTLFFFILARLSYSGNANLNFILGNECKNSGFEVSVRVWPRDITQSEAIQLWKDSPGHARVIFTEGPWKILKKMGCANFGQFAHCWFSAASDTSC